MDIKYTFRNADKVIAAARQFPDIFLRNMVTAAEVSSRDIARTARAIHLFRTRGGDAERGIEPRDPHIVDQFNVQGEVWLNPQTKHLTYLHEGTGLHGKFKKAYNIFPKNKKRLRFLTSKGTAPLRKAPFNRFQDGGFTLAKGVTHPGIKGDPFLYRAGDMNQQHINDVFNRYADRAIKEAGL